MPSAVDWEKTVSSTHHSIGSCFIPNMVGGGWGDKNLPAVHEKHFCLTRCDWQRYVVLVYENESGTCAVDLQMSNITPRKVSSNQSRGDERVCYCASQMIFNRVESEWSVSVSSSHLNSTFAMHKVRQLVLFFHAQWWSIERIFFFFFCSLQGSLWLYVVFFPSHL